MDRLTSDDAVWREHYCPKTGELMAVETVSNMTREQISILFPGVIVLPNKESEHD